MTSSIMPQDEDDDLNESYHYAVDRQNCKEMEKRQGWRLQRVEESKDPILKAKCVFAGQTEFPDRFKENEEKDA